MTQQDFDAVRERLYKEIDDRFDYFNLQLSVKLLLFAQKYRIITHQPGFDLRKHNASSTSMANAIKMIHGVYDVDMRINDWKAQAHVWIAPGFFNNLVFNMEFHRDIQNILRTLLPAEYSSQVILYSKNEMQ